ncbi:DNA polymerase alpha 2 [Artemisia annua]|uniref:DNA polymerase alpha subunit B n=1 Tax=Artemisia annua TaxID=35608 RepID=A0A2U1KHF1_ARTAN|nr:DNA polymerase alpha 2 [Artemisia annua]
MEDQIRTEFKKNNFVLVEEEQILQKCVTFCINYNLSPSDLVSSWDLYSINRQLDVTVSDAHMDAFRQQLQSEQKQAIIEKEQGLHSYTDLTMEELIDEQEAVKEVVPTSPAAQDVLRLELFDATPVTNGKTHSLGKPLELVTPFGQRKDKFVVHSTLNNLPIVDGIKVEQGEEKPDEDMIIKRVQPVKRCSLEVHGSKPAPGCMYMYDRIEDKFNCLEDRIMKYSKALVASQLYEEVVDPSVASQKSIFAVGMICCEEEGRLKEKPIMLQSSVEHSGGQRVRLDLQKLDQFSIFPGQVVGVEGHNPSGHYLIATKIVDYVPLSVPDDEDSRETKRIALDPDNQLADPSDITSDLSLIIASGPYTTADNMFFEPLSDLLAYAQRKQPQLLVLLGPFIDSEHPDIKKGALNRTYDELFRLEILRRLQDYVEYMGSAARVVLVPSIRDAHHDFVFPQPPFDINVADPHQQITCITNPGIISANKVKIGCCSVDVLKQLSTDLVTRGIKNRMNTLTNHLLSQRSFYPLYPPAEDTPLDLSLAPEALQMSIVPDILIVPSDLTQFVKVLSLEGTKEGEEVKCMCVNPGRLARGEGGGHFVELNFHGNPDSSSASVIRI